VFAPLVVLVSLEVLTVGCVGHLFLFQYFEGGIL